MVKFSLIFVIFMIIAAKASAQVNPRCDFSIDGGRYVCKFKISNPNGFDEFESVGVNHMSGKTNDDVSFVDFSQFSLSKNFPRIICDTFRNLKTIRINFENEIEEIGRNSFSNCKDLDTLYLTSNKLKQIDANAFENNKNIITLSIYRTQISQLPENVFKPLVNLYQLILDSNKFEVVHSNWFGFHPSLYDLDLEYNGIDALDEWIFEIAPRLRSLNFEGNKCASGTITDNREFLEPCFANFRKLFGSTTTTPKLETTTLASGECAIGDINDEICELKSRIRILEKFIATLPNAPIVP